MRSLLTIGIVGLTAMPGLAQTTLDLSGMQSWGLDGALENSLTVFDTPPEFINVVLSIQYDITIQTFGGSTFSDLNIRFGRPDGESHGNWPDTFAPGQGDNGSGIQRFTGTFGTDIHLNPESVFQISLFEITDDVLGGVDADLLEGSSITLMYFIPAPSAGVALGFGALLATRRRRA